MPVVKIPMFVQEPKRLEDWCPDCLKSSLTEVTYRMLLSSGVTERTLRSCRECKRKWDTWPFEPTYRD